MGRQQAIYVIEDGTKFFGTYCNTTGYASTQLFRTPEEEQGSREAREAGDYPDEERGTPGEGVPVRVYVDYPNTFLDAHTEWETQWDSRLCVRTLTLVGQATQYPEFEPPGDSLWAWWSRAEE